MTDLPFPGWAASDIDARFTAPSELGSKRTMFERKIRRRNFVEYAAGILCAAVFGWVAWLTAGAGEYLVSASWLAMIVCTAVVLLNLRRIASVLPHIPEEDCRSHLRAQMVHQHKALSSVSRWYIGPFIPGMMFVLLAMAELTSAQTGWLIALGAMAGPALIVGTLFAVVIWLNRRAARALAGEIAKLDDLAGSA